MKKILFTLEIALFLSALPVTLGLAMSREFSIDKKSEMTAPVVKKDLQSNTISDANTTSAAAAF